MSGDVVKFQKRAMPKADNGLVGAIELASLMGASITIDPGLVLSGPESLVGVIIVERLRELIEAMNAARDYGMMTGIDIDLTTEGYRLAGVQFGKREQ